MRSYDFLLHRDEVYAVSVTESLNRVLPETQAMAKVDPEGAEAGARIVHLVDTYRQRFEAVSEAWHS